MRTSSRDFLVSLSFKERSALESRVFCANKSCSHLVAWRDLYSSIAPLMRFSWSFCGSSKLDSKPREIVMLGSSRPRKKSCSDFTVIEFQAHLPIELSSKLTDLGGVAHFKKPPPRAAAARSPLANAVARPMHPGFSRPA